MGLLAAEFYRGVGAVAERLVPGLAAAAERDAVAQLVGKAVPGDHGDSAAQPERAAALLRRVLDQADRDRQFRLQGLPRRLVPSHQAAGRAVCHLPDEAGPYPGSS